jgi:hypothetical protein
MHTICFLGSRPKDFWGESLIKNRHMQGTALNKYFHKTRRTGSTRRKYSMVVEDSTPVLHREGEGNFAIDPD